MNNDWRPTMFLRFVYRNFDEPVTENISKTVIRKILQQKHLRVVDGVTDFQWFDVPTEEAEI